VAYEQDFYHKTNLSFVNTVYHRKSPFSTLCLPNLFGASSMPAGLVFAHLFAERTEETSLFSEILYAMHKGGLDFRALTEYNLS